MKLFCVYKNNKTGNSIIAGFYQAAYKRMEERMCAHKRKNRIKYFLKKEESDIEGCQKVWQPSIL